MTSAVKPARGDSPRRQKPVTPSLRRADPPKFAEMTPDDFEEFCCALLDKEPGVTRADLYHTRFDAQYGIDAFGETAAGLVVVSCKRCGQIRKGEIAKWSDDFLKHWDSQWKDKPVLRFVLAVTVNTNSQARLKDITAATARFAEHGVAFEVWAPRQIQERLRGQPGVVSQFLGGREWVERLCDADFAAQAADVTREDLKDRLEGLAQALSGETERSLETATRRLEQGDVAGVETLLASVRTGPGWDALTPDLKARTVRLQGSAALTRGDVGRAKVFSSEADAIAPASEPRLVALIAMNEHGAAAALEVLGEPDSPRGRSLRASLLLVTGETTAAERALDSMDVTDPETLRLRAYLELLRGDRAAGLAFAEKAGTADPDNPSVSRTLAMALYAASLSTSAPPQLALNPNPINWSLVKQDDLSTSRLDRALERFRPLANGDPLRASRDLDEAWVLACLANLPARREEAADQARRLLEVDPRDVQVIGWVLMRDLDVDLSSSRTALSAALKDRSLRPNEAMALDWLTAPEDDPALLTAVMSALASGDWDADAQAELEAVRARLEGRPVGDEVGPARLEAARLSGDWAEAEADFEAAMTAEAPAFTVISYASALSASGRWSVLDRHRIALLAFGTAGAVRIAATAAYNSGDATGALTILSDHASLFPGSRLPFGLRRIEAEALAQLGDHQQAVSRAAALAADSQTVADGLREARLRLNLGDLDGALPRVRAALDAGDLDPEEALVWSQTFAGEQLDLARDLWRHAVSRELDDQTALKAYGLSFSLGLEDEKGDLIAAVARLAETGQGVWKVSLDELKSELIQRQERAAEIDDKWKRAEAPVHLLAQAAGTSLAEIFDLRPVAGGRRPVLLRAGSRGEAFVDETPLSGRHYYLDTSALLIANQLDLLPILEGLGPRLCIGAATPHALMEIEQSTRHHQPAQAKAPRRVVAEIGRRIGTTAPVGAQRVVLDAVGADAVDLAQVLAGLEATGTVSDEDLAKWRDALDVAETPPVWPLAGASLEFTERSLERVIDIGAFDALTAVYAVFVDAWSLRAVRNVVDDLQQRAALTLSVGRLRRRLARKAETHYLFVGGDRRARLDPNQDAFSKSAVGRALAEVMTAADDSTSNRLWLEDRFLSSFSSSGAAPIVGVFDVLSSLKQEGRLDDDEYFSRLLKLREGRALFLPLDVAEVEYHLAAAPIRDGVVEEPPGLAAVRQNVGLALIYDDKLRIGAADETEGRPLELPFLLQLRRIAEAAVVARWNSQIDADTARAQCDWIWRSLRAETLPRHPGSDASGSETVAALNFAGLVAAAFQIRGAYGDPSWRRRELYLAWLQDTVIRTRLDFDRPVRDRAVEWARDLFRLDKIDTEGLDEEGRESARQFSRVVLTQLPEPLRDAMAADPGFLEDLGFEETTAITFEDKTFASSVFWRGVARAVNAGEGEAVFSDGSGRATFRLSAEDPSRIVVSGDVEATLRDSEFGLLSDDAERRDASVAELFKECDIPPADRPELAAAIFAEVVPDRRIQVARTVKDRSVRLYLDRLAASLKSRDDVGADEFDPPALRDWLTYVRWREPDTQIEAAARSLRLDLPPGAALARIASLPFALPAEAWQDVDIEKVRALTPLARIHRLHAIRSGFVPADAHDLEAEVLATAEAVSRFGDLFLALLRWGAEAFARQKGWATLPPLQKHVVSWCFADRVTDLLGTIGLDPEAGAGFFQGQRSPTSAAALLSLQHGYDDSSLHSVAMTKPLLLMAGLEFGLGDKAAQFRLPKDAMETVALVLDVKPEAEDRRPAIRRFEPRAEVGSTWMDLPSPTSIEGHDLEKILDDAVTALEANGADQKAWAFIFAVGLPALPDGQAARLATIIAALDLTQIVEGTEAITTLRHVAEVAGRLAGDDASDAVLDKLIDLAPGWLAKGGASEFASRLDGLVEAGAAAARSYSGQGPERFARFLVRLIDPCPETAPELRSILNDVVDLTPVRDAAPFWRALKVARAT